MEEDLLTNARTRTVVIRQACAERNGVLTSVTNVRGVLNIAKITFTSGVNVATCDYTVNRTLDRCPLCGIALTTEGVCPKCGYRK